MAMINRTRIARLGLTGIATTGAAAAALTLMPANAQAAESTRAHATAVVSSGNDSRGASASKSGSANNLDGWIKQSLSIMKAKGIPGSYEGLKRNI
ncbi:phage tail tape measure protein, partial [Streptomyces sp. NPDC052107]